MAKKKRSRRRTSLLTKAINVGVLALAFSPLIVHLQKGRPIQDIVTGYSMGLSEGKFDKAQAMGWYGPVVAAIILKKAISMVRKIARV